MMGKRRFPTYVPVTRLWRTLLNRSSSLLAAAFAAILLQHSLAPSASADTTYLTKDEALKLVLGTECELQYEKKTLPPELIEQLEELRVAPEDEPISHVFTCRYEGKVSGYAFIDQQIGKHAPITFIVGISPEGTVMRTEIMVYRELYGSQARERGFLQQFEGKSDRDDVTIGAIRHVSGATLSSKAISRGVRRNLAIWKFFFGGQSNA